MIKKLTINDTIQEWLKRFEMMTKEEADNIECIVKWDEETKSSFLLAKRLFEVKDEDE